MNFSPASSTLPSIADIEDAAARLAGVAVRTPLLEAPALNRMVKGRILIKAEPLQRTGSFKFRGAYNRICRLSDEEKSGGVVAFSSGNHAQGVAHAAALLGTRAAIVMPADAPAIKIENTRAYGADVVLYDRHNDNREEIGDRIAKERGSIVVPPYDDLHVIAGQGTIGLEIAEQLAELGARPDLLLTNCGGGGMTAGISLALRDRLPGLPVYAVEPEGFDDTRRSLEAGEHVANDPAARSICDALLTPTPGKITFAINRGTLSGGLAVTDEEVRAAMRAAFLHLKLVIEPGGAVSLAAALSGRLDLEGKTVVVVSSGGNVDPGLYADILRQEG